MIVKITCFFLPQQSPFRDVPQNIAQESDFVKSDPLTDMSFRDK